MNQFMDVVFFIAWLFTVAACAFLAVTLVGLFGLGFWLAATGKGLPPALGIAICLAAFAFCIGLVLAYTFNKCGSSSRA